MRVLLLLLRALAPTSGFVPPANPHDDAVLWPDLASALDWHYERFGVTQVGRGGYDEPPPGGGEQCAFGFVRMVVCF